MNPTLKAALLCGVISLFVGGCRSRFIDATIENRSGGPVRLLEIDYPSASFGVDQLDADSKFNYRFQIRGSGPISISYAELNRSPIHITGPTLSEGQQGHLQIVLLPNAKTEFTPRLIEPH
jgi:hypothetical protein